MDHRMFNPQVEALLSSYRILVCDTRGHGRSQPIGQDFSVEGCAADMFAILDAISVQTTIAIGQSLGGYIAQHMALHAPERVRAMVIIGSTPITKAYNVFEVLALKATMPLFNIWPYNHFMRVVAHNTAITQKVQTYALEAIKQIPRENFLTIWKAVTVAVGTQGKPGVTFEMPLLLTHGDLDRTGTIRRDMPEWAAQLPHAVYHVIPEAGHNANQDNPAFTNQILTAFLDELS